MNPIRVVRVIRGTSGSCLKRAVQKLLTAESAEHAEPIDWFLCGLGVLSGERLLALQRLRI
jgi:hypothetical protein